MTAPPYPPGIASPPWGIGQGGTPVMVPPSSMGPGGRPMVAAISMQIPLPEVFPIPDAKEFNPTGSIANTGATVNPIEITNTITLVPDGTMGIIRGVQLYINDMLPTTDVKWSLIIDTGSPQGFNGITMFPRTAPFVGNAIDAGVRFNGPARISVVFTQTDAGTYLIGAGYSGWYWPTASDARWRKFGS